MQFAHQAHAVLQSESLPVYNFVLPNWVEGGTGDAQSNADTLIVHPRVVEKRPWLSEEGVKWAWRTALSFRRRPTTDPPQTVAVGFDLSGHLLEMSSFLENNTITIYHAMSATKKFLLEVGFTSHELRDLRKGRNEYFI
jgi:hypothetical protein